MGCNFTFDEDDIECQICDKFDECQEACWDFERLENEDWEF